MAILKDKIVAVLKQNPKGIKAREIAYKIGVTRTEVNSFLYSHKSEFSVNENFLWTIKSASRSVNTASKKAKDEWHDTSNVRAINEELKRQRLERKKQEEQIIILEPIEEGEKDEEFDLTEFIENYKPDPDIYPFLAKEEPKKCGTTPLYLDDFDDGHRTCRTCGKKFKLSQGEIEFYQNKGLCLPTHCRECLDSGIAGIEYIRETYGIRSYSNFGHIPRKFGGPKN